MMADPVSVLLIGAPLMMLALVNVYGVWHLRNHLPLARFVATEDLHTIVPSHDPRHLEELAKGFHGLDHLTLLEQVMDLVGKCEPGPSTDVLHALEHVRRGGGLLCSGMANLYFNVLRLNGFIARRTYLMRHLFDRNDTHVTVEVLVDGKWIIFDPTFHVGFEKNGQLIGAQTISESLHDGSFNTIKPRFYGSVRYPPRLETYYTHWLPLFNNVLIPDRDQPYLSLWARIPPLRYWCGPVMYFQKVPNVSYEHLRFQDGLYFLFVVVLPLALLGMICMSVLTLLAM
jgi:hypothetical protein